VRCFFDIVNFQYCEDCIIISHTGDLAAAIRNYTDIHFGLYYSLFEWYHPLFLQDKANQFKTNDYMRVCVHVSVCV